MPQASGLECSFGACFSLAKLYQHHQFSANSWTIGKAWVSGQFTHAVLLLS
jgi:hypothetical protein